MEYESLMTTEKGLSIIKSNNQYGIIGTGGRVLVPCIHSLEEINERIQELEIYKSINVIEDQTAIVQDSNGYYGVYLGESKLVVPCEYNSFSDLESSLLKYDKADDNRNIYGYINKCGEFVRFDQETSENNHKTR